MRKLKIGYLPLSVDYSAPGDRRRLVFWANSRGHEIVRNPNSRIDVLVATEKSDFNSPMLQKGSQPIVFDLIDGYLSPQNYIEDLARGLAKRMVGEISAPLKPFSSHIKHLCAISSAVLCSSIEQKKLIENYNQNTHIILDSHYEIPFLSPRNITTKPVERKVKIFWEGQPATLSGFTRIAEIVKRLNKEIDTSLNFVTDERYYKYLNRFGVQRTEELLVRNLNGFNKFRLLPWSIHNLVKFSQESILSLIPLDLSASIQTMKPENRLLIMWKLGLPCLTSPSMAYSRIEQQTGISIVCKDDNEWFEKSSKYIFDKKFARSQVLLGQEYLRENHSENILLEKWDRAIASVV